MTNPRESIEPKSFFYTILPILLCGLSIPLSIFLWIGNLALTFITKNSLDSEGEYLSQKGKRKKNIFLFKKCWLTFFL